MRPAGRSPAPRARSAGTSAATAARGLHRPPGQPRRPDVAQRRRREYRVQLGDGAPLVDRLEHQRPQRHHRPRPAAGHRARRDARRPRPGHPRVDPRRGRPVRPEYRARRARAVPRRPHSPSRRRPAGTSATSIAKAFRRVCVDIRTREVLGLYGYHRVDPPCQLCIWKEALAEARERRGLRGPDTGQQPIRSVQTVGGDMLSSPPARRDQPNHECPGRGYCSHRPAAWCRRW